MFILFCKNIVLISHFSILNFQENKWLFPRPHWYDAATKGEHIWLTIIVEEKCPNENEFPQLEMNEECAMTLLLLFAEFSHPLLC